MDLAFSKIKKPYLRRVVPLRLPVPLRGERGAALVDVVLRGCIDEVLGCATLEKLKKLKGLFGYFLLLGTSFRDMDSYILTCFHHEGCVVGNPNPTYQREVDVFGVGIDKDHFSLVEFLSYTKDLGYTNVKGFYCEDNNELVQVTSDTQLLEFVKDLVDGDEFHVYVVHEVDELEELPAPTGLLPWSDTVDESVGINTEGTVENDSDLNGVDTELPGGDTNQNEAESDLPSSDIDVDVIPDEDDSDVDEELRSLRAERRNKRNPNLRKKKDREKKTITKEVPIGEASVDRGFEDIGINKKDRYVGRLGGDEKYIDSSECDSDDSTDMLDAEAVGGVDLPGRRKSKKVSWKKWKQSDPIVWAVVDKETKHSWSFFINYLKEDLQLGTGQGLTVMLDMQKGLQAAVGELLPNAEVRMCARHIWSNWSKRWRGEKMRKQFWRCSKATFKVKYSEELYKMSRLGNEINDDLLHYPQVSWVRAFFQEHSKCDAVENNILMLEENKEKSRACKVLWNADVGFEIGEGQYRHTVNLTNRVCSCRTWQLRGIPCQHAISVLYHIEQEPEPLVEHWYRKDTFLKAYSHFIQPISNMKMWSETNNPRIEPPKPKQMSGRPPRNRRKSKDEPRKKYGKMSKQGLKITCSKCRQQGHNKKYCKVGVHTSQLASHSSQFTAGQSSQGSCHPNQQAPSNLDQQDSTNLLQQHQTIMLLQQQFVVIPVELKGQGKLQKQANHHHLWIQVFLLQEE
ncbi:hypothetical protein MTR67_000620 [Solanum verrucosum]|uniref:SWIM-type domain-containing protein n=2 Tax=Solanum TaxID=4107 RepID=A0AAF0PNZ4_SOLVR|nr:hypothetical protein MTR67_000620 [Solanum verrucosum]